MSYKIKAAIVEKNGGPENILWRERHDWAGCIYGTPCLMASHMTKDIKVIVLEMNNSTEQIMGAGVVLNRHRFDCPTRIYSDINYNRYIYRSIHRKDRKDIENKDILKFLETLVFKSKGHLKRSHGISIIPIKWKKKFVFPKRMLKASIIEELKNGGSPKEIIRKYRKLHLDLFNFLNVCFKGIKN